MKDRKTSKGQKPTLGWVNPGKVVGRDGKCVITSGTKWQLHNDLQNDRINWRLLSCDSDVVNAMQAYLAHIIETQAPGSVFSVFEKLKVSFDALPPGLRIRDLTYVVLENLFVILQSKGLAWRFGTVRRWYRWCQWQHMEGFKSEITERLFRLKVPSNVTGQAVVTRDPSRGPLTEEEHRLLQQATKHKKGPLQDRIIIMIMIELGARPGQVILLNEADFKLIVNQEGLRFYSLDVPRLKQRTVIRERKRRRISETLGEALGKLIEERKDRHGPSHLETPLLCLSCGKAEHSCLRMPRPAITKIVSRYPSKASLVSPRTGKLLKLFPYRIRYTYGTRLANQGTPIAVLAELLDQTTKEAARIYTASSSKLVDRLNKALGGNHEYTEMMGYFAGTIINKNTSNRKTISGSTPTLKNLGGIGSCGASYLCKLMPPLSCYLCPKFQAWSDGPHTAMLEELENYVELLVQRNGNPSDRIPYQLSEVIAALRQLLERLANRGWTP